MNPRFHKIKINGLEQVGGTLVGDKIDAVIEWSEQEAPISFDDTMIRSFKKSFKDYDGLTTKQFTALNNIVESFHIDLEEYGFTDDEA